MTKRLLERGISSGRVDDNEETIKKRLETFHKHSEPVMKHYSTKVAHIDANTNPDTIFAISVENVDKVLVAAGIPLPS